MHSYLAVFSLFAASLVNGTPVHSNSPHSPYTQLKILSEEVKMLKDSLEKIKPSENISETLVNDSKQLAEKIEQLENQNKQLEEQNKNLQDQLTDLDKVYKKQTQELLALSKDFQEFRSKSNNANTSNPKSRDIASVKKEISLAQESVKKTQQKMDDFGKQWVNDSQNFQDQLQKVKSEFLAFCQATNQKLQDFSEQMRSNLSKVSHNSCVKHTITSGESLASIARLYGTTPDQILSANHLTDTRGLHVGDAILVPQEVF